MCDDHSLKIFESTVDSQTLDFKLEKNSMLF